MQVTVSGNNAGKTTSLLLSRASSAGVRCATLAAGYHSHRWKGLTPASAADLPPLGELLVVDDPFWQYPARGLAREGAGHVRVWAAAAASAGYLVLTA